MASFARELADDPRAAPLSAGVAAVAVFGSLVSEWQVTKVSGSALGNGSLGDKVIPADLADLGAFGGGYLAGLFLLAAAVTLALFGPSAGRTYARLAGLSVGGTMLGLLLALTSLLGDQSRIVSRIYTLEVADQQIGVSYGRGLWCALAGVSAAMFALWLAGRAVHEPIRLPRAREDDEASPDVPFELTVTAAPPFTPDSGISG